VRDTIRELLFKFPGFTSLAECEVAESVVAGALASAMLADNVSLSASLAVAVASGSGVVVEGRLGATSHDGAGRQGG